MLRERDYGREDYFIQCYFILNLLPDGEYIQHPDFYREDNTILYHADWETEPIAVYLVEE